MKYRGNPRVSPGFPDFYLTHKQCDRDGAARGLTGAPRDYINNNDLLCKQLQVCTSIVLLTRRATVLAWLGMQGHTPLRPSGLLPIHIQDRPRRVHMPI